MNTKKTATKLKTLKTWVREMTLAWGTDRTAAGLGRAEARAKLAHEWFGG